MGLLDGGIQALFGSAFGAIYLDATLHRRTIAYQTDGDAVPSDVDEAVKAQQEEATEQMREAVGYTDRDVAIFILQSGIATAPTTDDEITIKGVRWKIAGPITEDPASAYWLCRGQLA